MKMSINKIGYTHTHTHTHGGSDQIKKVKHVWS